MMFLQMGMSLSGGSTRMLDVYDKISAREAIVFLYALISLTVFAVLAYHLSVLAAFRSLASTAVVYCVAQCICMGIWQFGWLSSDPRTAWGASHGVSWFQSLIGCAFVFALILGFDFMQYRDVSAYREQGWDKTSAFALGLTARGSMLSSAGIIMAICWIGLIFTSVTFLNQLG